MPYDGADFDINAAEDLRLMRATLRVISDKREWSIGWNSIDNSYCVVGWLNIYAGDTLMGETGLRIASERLYPALPPWWKIITSYDYYQRSADVMYFNDTCGWRRTRRLLARAIKYMEHAHRPATIANYVRSALA